ncbi:hypothetical protein BDR07DRAFT_938350 [Suillus spraguei]|nr:hypothetical protein BDR07DRAFT_938350 [Suillus spraguei]
MYFARFTSDGLALKATVSAVLLFQLGHFVCVMSTLWTMTVSTYGDPSQLKFSSSGRFGHSLAKNVSLPILCQTFSMVAQISTLILVARANFYDRPHKV